MKEIKFRAFIKDDDFTEMIYDVIPFAFDDDLVGMNGDMYCPFSDVMQVMQYIGLKDKNGKEIYEGDVVKLIGVAGEEGVGEVIFDKENASFCVKTIENKNKIDFWDFYQLLLVFRVKIEIIGNIFENPELLE